MASLLWLIPGYRSPQHSKEVVKAKPGEHTRGAADIECLDSWKRFIIVMEAMNLGFNGIGIAKTFVHVDKTEPPCHAYGHIDMPLTKVKNRPRNP